MDNSQIIIWGSIIIPASISLVVGFWALLRRIDSKSSKNDLKIAFLKIDEKASSRDLIKTESLFDKRVEELKSREKSNHGSQEIRLDAQREEDSKIRERIAKLEEVDRQQEVRLDSQNTDIKELKKEMQEGFKEINGKIDSLILSINSWHSKAFSKKD